MRQNARFSAARAIVPADGAANQVRRFYVPALANGRPRYVTVADLRARPGVRACLETLAGGCLALAADRQGEQTVRLL